MQCLTRPTHVSRTVTQPPTKLMMPRTSTLTWNSMEAQAKYQIGVSHPAQDACWPRPNLILGILRSRNQESEIVHPSPTIQTRESVASVRRSDLWRRDAYTTVSAQAHRVLPVCPLPAWQPRSTDFTCICSGGKYSAGSDTWVSDENRNPTTERMSSSRKNKNHAIPYSYLIIFLRNHSISGIFKAK